MLAYSGRGKLEVKRADLSKLISDTTYLLQSSIGRSCVLRYQLAADLPPVEVDVTQIRQIIMNLVINASEAIGPAAGTITLTTGRVKVDRVYLGETSFGRELPEGDYVFLEVSDTG